LTEGGSVTLTPGRKRRETVQMTAKSIRCPGCGRTIVVYRNPVPTVDIIIEGASGGVLLIRRKNPPEGWAIPGGFVDYGESLESAAVREAKEETGLDVELLCQLHTYSDPDRDKRCHTISTVYIANSKGIPKAGDDAADVQAFTRETLPAEIAFDHRKILEDYFNRREREVSGC
jgi:ADP-ribose pyrophosphatase YjhB (NUDIX family)